MLKLFIIKYYIFILLWTYDKMMIMVSSLDFFIKYFGLFVVPYIT